MRTHAVGFPTVFESDSRGHTGVRFAMLMRAPCGDNDGTFVALNTARR